MALLEVMNVHKTYTGRFGSQSVKALNGVDFRVEKGEYVAIMGESGSGKTTLLNLLAAFDQSTDGDIKLEGRSLNDIEYDQLADFRREYLGFVFQDFNLLDNFSLEDNILLPLVLANQTYSAMQKQLQPIVEKLAIADVIKKYPYEVSGGQKQRAAIARAIINHPTLILADEPTGALDSSSSAKLMTVFEQLNREGQTILMVTHSVRAASSADRVLFIKDGVIFHQLYRGEMTDDAMYQTISESLILLAGKVGDENA